MISNLSCNKYGGATWLLRIYLRACLLFISFLVFSDVNSQSIFVSPQVGVELPTCYKVKPVPGNSVLRTMVLPINPVVGGKVTYIPSSEKWNLSVGYLFGATTYSLRLKYSDEEIERATAQAPPGIGVSGSITSTNSPPVHRINVLYSRFFNQVQLFRIHEYEGGYLINFKPYLKLGPEFVQLYKGTTWGNPGASIESDSILGYSPHPRLTNITFPNSFSVAGHLAAGLQFYRKGKYFFTIEGYYKQGFRDILSVNVEYQLITDNHDLVKEQIRARGSAFGVSVSYPIRLINFKSKQLEDADYVND